MIQFIELFDKEKKTTDSVVDERLKLIDDFDSNLKTYLSNMEQFTEASVCKSLNILTSFLLEMLDAHSTLGETLQLLYSQSAFHFYTLEVAKLLA